jgi:cholesterol transport system auxiliary component
MDTGLLVRLPEAEAIYDTTGMAYTAETYEVGYFSEYVWAEKPAQMIQGLLVGTLQRTHHFREVIVPPHFSSYGYVLNSRVLALSQDYTAKPPVLRAALRVQLVDTASNRVMATKDVATTEPIKERGPYGGVVAANEAIARILREIAQFTIEVTAPHGGER